MKQNYDIFEQYLNGELQGQALTDFETQIKTDSGLAAELDLFRKVKSGISDKLNTHSGKEALMKTIGEIGGEYFDDGQQSSDGDTSGSPRILSMNRRFFLTAVAVAASVLLLVFVWQPWQEDLPLYDQYAQLPVAEFTSRSTAEVDFKAMEDAYNKGEYTMAIQLFEQHLSVKPSDAEIVYYKGLSHLELGEFDKAMVLFDQTVSGPSGFKDNARWYLALIYLKQGDIDRCKQFLSAIPEVADKYAQARELLSKLK